MVRRRRRANDDITPDPISPRDVVINQLNRGDVDMKTFSQALFLALSISTAYAATYQLPTVYQLTGHACGQEIVAYHVTGTDPNTGYVTGLVYGQTVCSAGGRGAGNTYYAGCYSVEWVGDTLIQPMTEAWRRSGRVSIPVTECFGT